MNKLILSLLVLCSFALYAQEEAPVELNEEGMESNPLESSNPDEAVSSEESAPIEKAIEETPAEEAKAEPVAEQPTAEEAIAADKAAAKAETNLDEFVAPADVPVASNAETQKLEAEIEADDRFHPNKSHWYTIFGFEAMEYTVPFAYDGVKEDFTEENRQLYGGRLGFGGEIYLGAGFLTSTRVEGYYMGTLFEKAKTADPELEDEDVATTKDAGQIYGGDIVQTLSFFWELKTKNPIMEYMTYLTVEPFIEVGIGRAWAFNKKDYSYDTGTTNIQEEYDQNFEDELTNTKIGGGINFTSRQGFFLYLKATQNRYDITKRTTKGYFYRDGASRAEVNPNASTDIEPIMVYSFGGGYKF